MPTSNDRDPHKDSVQQAVMEWKLAPMLGGSVASGRYGSAFCFTLNGMMPTIARMVPKKMRRCERLLGYERSPSNETKLTYIKLKTTKRLARLVALSRLTRKDIGDFYSVPLVRNSVMAATNSALWRRALRRCLARRKR